MPKLLIEGECRIANNDNTQKRKKVKNVHTKERDDIMATLTKPTRLSVISAERSKSFIEKFNANKPTDAFIESCKEAGKLFKKKRWTER